ncbi:hypothetical protein P152DRAFT_451155 [Eremomyces bilateralis CBS 781.70]|uniref:CUE domain-containing protein n=1 Tax=Eremomyces bilateralis CBS 781.70 TaxID=1392243 RepID=A0A6G1FX39_9PEZI|nr:uncharacterized protein P152DRAFT_451155 [Eremomyces bilateralis CBS 781.70]KAF1810407.1 hypothetical protein P152DRAFT_451155 [Eremomyces bilateralis CBS 781.70]
MSEKPTEKPAPGSGRESPRTARDPDFDDDPEEIVASAPAFALAPAASEPKPKPRVSFADEEQPPVKPPRPVSPQAQAEATLVEAFPSVDTKVVQAVLRASGGKMEPAFNALLSMSDPNYQDEPAPLRQPPRPTQARTQLEADELYARQLAEHYQSQGHEGFGSRGRGDPPMPRGRQESGLKPNEMYDDRDHSFFDDDLPVIRENIRKGFVETQSWFNKTISDLKKKMDGEDDDDLDRPGAAYQRQNYGPSQSDQMRGIRRSAETRGSGDRHRYDADPRVLDDDFTALELRDDEHPPPKPARPLANPDLFKPTPAAPRPGPVDEIDAIYGQPTRDPSPGVGKTKKWQPLTSVAPNPEGDNDPFSLGDSDEEEAKTKDLKQEDTERLKKSASASVSEGTGAELPKLEKAETSGTKDKDAEELLKNKT